MMCTEMAGAAATPSVDVCREGLPEAPELRWPEGKTPNLRRRIVSGIALPCRYCVKDFIDFDIVIDKDRIVSAVPRALGRAAGTQALR